MCRYELSDSQWDQESSSATQNQEVLNLEAEQDQDAISCSEELH